MALATTNTDRATETFNTLQSVFWSNNMWRSSMWWQAANTVEAIANHALQTPSVKPRVELILGAVFAATANSTIARCDAGVDLTFSGYFDDELWWGHAWLRAHKLTAEPRYLNRACAIFDDIVNRSWSDASCGGGCCWQAPHDADHMSGCYKNAITNELFLSLGAQLSNLYQQRCDAGTKAACDAAKRYHSWSLKELQWFLNSGMINASNLINDGLDTFGSHPKICADNGHTAYSYNQGVLLSGLGELYASKLPPPPRGRAEIPAYSASSSSSAAAVEDDDDRNALLKLACAIIEAVWRSSLVWDNSNGVLREMSEVPLVDGTIENLYTGGGGTDGLQFKSVLLRHQRYLIDSVLRAHNGSEVEAQRAIAGAGGNLTLWRERTRANADAIWQHAACVPPSKTLTPGNRLIVVPALFGWRWLGPCTSAFGGASATTQTAALDVFSAAAF